MSSFRVFIQLSLMTTLFVTFAHAGVKVLGGTVNSKPPEDPPPLKIDRSDCGCATPQSSTDGSPLQLTDLGLVGSQIATCPPPATDGSGFKDKDSTGQQLIADVVKDLNFNDPRQAFIHFINDASRIKQADSDHSLDYNGLIEHFNEDKTKAGKTYRCGLLDEELVAIIHYTEYGYLDTNGKFDENGTVEKNESLTPVGKYYRRILKSALRKMRKLNATAGVEDTLDPCRSNPSKALANKAPVLYHGNTFGGKDRKSPGDIKISQGDLIAPDAFISTTSDKKVTDGFGADLLSINSCKYGVYIGGVSAHPEEKEVLFCPGTQFKIKNVNPDQSVKFDVNKNPLPGGFSTQIEAVEEDETDPCADNEWEHFEAKLEKQKQQASPNTKNPACNPNGAK